jgi:hypothetical protein
MAVKKAKDRGSTPERAAEKPGHETVVAPFGDIIDAILEANPEGLREHMEGRRARSKKKPHARTEKSERDNDNSHIKKPVL